MYVRTYVDGFCMGSIHMNSTTHVRTYVCKFVGTYTEACSHFYQHCQSLLMVAYSYSVQGLVAKVKDTV